MKTQKQYSFFLFLFVLLFSFPGCFFSPKKRLPTPRVTQIRNKGKHDVQLNALWLNENACKSRFWGVDFSEHEIEVLQVRLVNNGAQSYLFRPSYCALDRLSVEEVAPLLQYDTTSRVCWYSLPALLFWWPAIPIFVVPQGIYWSNENRRIYHWLTKTTLSQDSAFELGPYETVEKYLFVPEYAAGGKTILFELFDIDTKELVSHTISCE
ncbi:MAG: hypothetical protein UV38_C0003G0253 [candidate division TM6 bacterium GW2011_GWE2_42_60]|nr:MAG: hypothetical protein UV38_C0003G0253 [candidate division TM6 bacterium GW2011_GWE2_42_60]HBY05872.1 hypothetical protein [Candidatus Dependentiae bacterium]